VEEYTVSTERGQVIEEMEVVVASTSLSNHTVIFAGDAKEKTTTCYEVSSSPRVFSSSIRLRFISEKGTSFFSRFEV
jgi:hypothetical protein